MILLIHGYRFLILGIDTILFETFRQILHIFRKGPDHLSDSSKYQCHFSGLEVVNGVGNGRVKDRMHVLWVDNVHALISFVEDDVPFDFILFG